MILWTVKHTRLAPISHSGRGSCSNPSPFMFYNFNKEISICYLVCRSLNLQYDARSVDCLMTLVGVETEWLYFPFCGAHCFQSSLCKSNPNGNISFGAHCFRFLLWKSREIKCQRKITENDGGITSCTYFTAYSFFRTEECCTACIDVTIRALGAYMQYWLWFRGVL